jgi:hypothetical protein
LVFDAQQDRVWRGNSTEGFTEMTGSWLGGHSAGRGMGIVAGQLDGHPGLDLVVANDMTANHYWTRDRDSRAFQLSEQSTTRGLAFNARSLVQASMGIAAGDADRDGDVDLLMTHFSNDHNTFYEQVAAGVWSDHSRLVGLDEPSLQTLGYGTQWVDLENDGGLELMVANGDIDDFSHQGRAFRQRPQLFRRLANGRWVQLSAKDIGAYFSSERLGRAVVRLDANRDQRTDLVVTHLFDPVALLINESPATGNQVRFFLRGVNSERDAVGAVIEVTAGGRSQTGQLFAGDGYQCSNERCVTFGLDQSTEIASVVVTWPDGSQQHFGQMVAGRDYLLVQGQSLPFPLEKRLPK